MRGIDELTGLGRIHMVAIGGSGMGAIANVLLDAGAEVTGSHEDEAPALEGLRARGAKVWTGHSPSHVEGAALVVYSVAVPPGNVELQEARRLGLPVLTRAEALARIVEGSRTVAVTGTHGKTTTSAMVSTVLTHAGWDPTFLIGGDVKGLPGASGGHLGAGDVSVVEADEAYGSFLHLHPSVAVVLNLDIDHLDHYGDAASLHRAFEEFTANAAETAVVCADHPDALRVAQHPRRVLFGFAPEASVRAEDVHLTAEGVTFELERDGERLGLVRMPVWGNHSVSNATAAAAAALELGVPDKVVVEGLSRFEGVSRRFELRGTIDGAVIADDYAHLPAEIEAVLAAARTGPWQRVIGVFQPHLYSRTRENHEGFARALAGCDLAVVTDVYGSRERPDPAVTGKLVSDALCELVPGRRVAYLPRLEDLPPYIRTIVRSGDLVLMMGAGDITLVSSWLSRPR